MKILKKDWYNVNFFTFGAGASHAETWNMALAYGASNFHSANAAEFAKAVTEKSGGKLTIKTHPGDHCSKAELS